MKEQSINSVICRCASSHNTTAARKKEYVPLSLAPLSMMIENSILTGSIMDTNIQVMNVEATDYQPGFDTPNHDFDITFE